MTVAEHIRTAAASLRRRPLQAALLCLTAAAGIASVVAVISVVSGGTQAFLSDMSKLGIDVIVFTIPRETRQEIVKEGPVAGMADFITRRTISEGDAEAMDDFFVGRDVRVSLVMGDMMPVAATGGSATALVLSIDLEFMKLFTLPLKSGRWFEERDLADGARICLVDEARAAELFGTTDVAGRKIRLGVEETVELTVIGVVSDPLSLRAHMERFDTGSLARDIVTQHLTFKNVYILRGAFEKPEGLQMKPFPFLLIKPGEGESLQSVRQEAQTRLDSLGVASSCYTMDGWIKMLQRATDRIDTGSSVIWIIILGVAGILIMTVSALAVRERFREIAIRRVEGATRIDIVVQVGLESLVLTLVGGVLGVVVGVFLALALSSWVVEWPAFFSFWEIAFALGLAVFLGAVAGVLPALRAARVDPAATLRYE